MCVCVHLSAGLTVAVVTSHGAGVYPTRQRTVTRVPARPDLLRARARTLYTHTHTHTHTHSKQNAIHQGTWLLMMFDR